MTDEKRRGGEGAPPRAERVGEPGIEREDPAGGEDAEDKDEDGSVARGSPLSPWAKAQIAFLLVAAAVVYIAIRRWGSGTSSESAGQQSSSAASRSPDGVLGAQQRATIIDRLKAFQGSPVWFVTDARFPEAVAYARALAGAFIEAGWDVRGTQVAAMPLRPGISVLGRDNPQPPYVDAVLGALHAAGLEALGGSDYGAFYAERKRANPDWQGFELTESQTYVVVVGRPGPPAK